MCLYQKNYVLGFCAFLLVVPKTASQDYISTKKEIVFTCAMPAKITLPKQLAKHIDLVVKRQVNVAFKISAHIITQNSFFVKKNKKNPMILMTKKRKKKKKENPKENKQNKPPTHNFCNLQKWLTSI